MTDKYPKRGPNWGYDTYKSASLQNNYLLRPPTLEVALPGGSKKGRSAAGFEVMGVSKR